MDVWGEIVSPLKKWHTAYEDFTVLCIDLFKRLDGQQLDQIAAVFHKLWARMNRLVFDQKFQSPAVIYKSTLDDLDVFKEVVQFQK